MVAVIDLDIKRAEKVLDFEAKVNEFEDEIKFLFLFTRASAAHSQ